ncbi:glycoside hydrolase family 68 protein [Flavobacterium sp. MC2016-06]|uniref:glycoside hydrolase family 68 protein n=1 Tax=Flavobacterium sp. MC2016-06 TaxID=2676308 RepID=UPI0012BABCC8|nr:glycoside hydrolase family 68 protein [Flavobacterium sp. MC2016-06]MBU3857857.1 glycoside hydrolase family 68 protein [Flavobacterium sp. MC2016-06]
MKFTKFFLFSILFTSICTAQDIVQLKNVSDTILNPKRVLRVSDPLDAVKTMEKLFPGKLYHLSDHNTFASWKCKICKPTAFIDVNGEEGDQLFPYTGGVATRLLTNIDYSDSKGNQFRLLFFNHSVYDEDGLQTSRFSGGLIGVAKFAKNNTAWEMKFFQPAIAAFGSFAQSPSPKLIQIGEDQYAVTLIHANGGAGGPYSGFLYLIAGLDGKYQSILEASDYQLTNSQSTAWSSSYTVVNDNTKKFFRDIVITTKGSYRKALPDDEFEVELPAEMAEMAKTKKQFDFVLEKRYVFKGKSYKLSGKPIVKYSSVK